VHGEGEGGSIKGGLWDVGFTSTGASWLMVMASPEPCMSCCKYV
jgi:hypothetical protein